MNASNRSPLPPWLVERIGEALASTAGPAGTDTRAVDAPTDAPKDAPPNASLTRVAQALRERAASSVAQEQGLLTVRASDSPWTSLADGLHMRELYRSPHPERLRPGEPLAVELWHVDPAFDVTLPTEDSRSVEWLLVRGDLEFDGRAMPVMSSVLEAPGARTRRMRSTQGAVLYRRVGRSASVNANASDHPGTRAASQAPAARWEPLLEGVERMTLWSDGTQEAYVIRARAGASAPGHTHAMDEECLVLAGEMYFGDQLLRAGDFQLATAGHDHTTIVAHTDALLYQRGEVLGG